MSKSSNSQQPIKAFGWICCRLHSEVLSFCWNFWARYLTIWVWEWRPSLIWKTFTCLSMMRIPIEALGPRGDPFCWKAILSAMIFSKVPSKAFLHCLGDQSVQAIRLICQGMWLAHTYEVVLGRAASSLVPSLVWRLKASLFSCTQSLAANVKELQKYQEK